MRVAVDAVLLQGMGRIEHPLDGFQPVALLAFGDVVAGKTQVIEDPVGIGPLPEQIVVLEEVVVADRGVRHDEGLHRHGILFHDVADDRVGVDDDLIGETGQPLTVERLVIGEALTEAPVAVHQRQADRGVSVEHLLGGDHLDLDRINVEPEFLDRDPLDRVIDLAKRREIPVRAGEERRRSLEPYHLGEARVRHGRPLSQIIRGTPKISAPGRRPGASRSAGVRVLPRCRLAIDRCPATDR